MCVIAGEQWPFIETLREVHWIGTDDDDERPWWQ